MRRVVENRTFVCFVLSSAIGVYLFRVWQFPTSNNVLQMVLLHKTYLFYAARYAFTAMLFTTPFIVLSVLFSFAYIFVVPQHSEPELARLPPYPAPEHRDRLFIVIGELHYPRRPEAAPLPRWLMVPERGLYTGVAIFGAIGSGKTGGCIYPFAEQLLGYRAQDRKLCVAGLALEVDRDIRDVIGARDLYVAEVNDIGRNARTEKPFGRVFFTKGKSLIFYAYDLDMQDGLRRASTFQAWGRRGPDFSAALPLGIMYMDNSAKRRWILRLDNPKTLAKIDAIFVTVEPSGGSEKPSGKPLLFAYLKIEANHP